MSNVDAESELVLRATGGDRPALERLLWSDYSHLSNRIAHKLTEPLKGQLSIDDILQDTFVLAIRDILQCTARSQRSFSAWLDTIADNRIRDACKRSKQIKHGGEHKRVHGRDDTSLESLLGFLQPSLDRGNTPSRSVARHEAIQAIQVAIAALPEDHRKVVELHHLQGKSLAETAVQIGKTTDAVRGLLYRAKENLEQAMGRASQWLSSR